jgi:hypothetical protein
MKIIIEPSAALPVGALIEKRLILAKNVSESFFQGETLAWTIYLL